MNEYERNCSNQFFPSSQHLGKSKLYLDMWQLILLLSKWLYPQRMIFIPKCVPEEQEDKVHQHILEQVMEEEMNEAYTWFATRLEKVLPYVSGRFGNCGYIP